MLSIHLSAESTHDVKSDVTHPATSAPHSAALAKPLAVIIAEHGEPADARMAALVVACRAHGLKVTGFIQHNHGDCALPGFSMALEEIGDHGGRQIPLVDASIIAGNSCRLDVAGLAEAAALLAPERHQGSDLVIINKFGRQESLGRGLRDEMAALIMAGVPVLTCVRANLREALIAFAGEDYVVIAPTVEAVEQWLAALKLAQTEGALA
ncbi:MAG: DUF2478 domain-containing protein [Bosea sp. (in: a-proteobacteria)]